METWDVTHIFNQQYEMGLSKDWGFSHNHGNSKGEDDDRPLDMGVPFIQTNHMKHLKVEIG